MKNKLIPILLISLTAMLPLQGASKLSRLREKAGKKIDKVFHKGLDKLKKLRATPPTWGEFFDSVEDNLPLPEELLLKGRIKLEKKTGAWDQLASDEQQFLLTFDKQFFKQKATLDGVDKKIMEDCILFFPENLTHPLVIRTTHTIYSNILHLTPRDGMRTKALLQTIAHMKSDGMISHSKFEELLNITFSYFEENKFIPSIVVQATANLNLPQEALTQFLEESARMQFLNEGAHHYYFLLRNHIPFNPSEWFAHTCNPNDDPQFISKILCEALFKLKENSTEEGEITLLVVNNNENDLPIPHNNYSLVHEFLDMALEKGVCDSVNRTQLAH